jgi:intracellular septation protein
MKAPEKEPSRAVAPALRAALDAGPLVVFFVAYWRWDIFAATGALIAAVAAALATSWWVERKLAVLPLVTFGFVLVFGGLTLLLRDSEFIKLKVTAINALFAATLLGGLAFGRPLLKPLLAPAFRLTDAGWRALTLRFGLFFVALAALNEVMWRTCDESTWVAFKSFGVLPLTIGFLFAQAPLIKRHAPPEESGR